MTNIQVPDEYAKFINRKLEQKKQNALVQKTPAPTTSIGESYTPREAESYHNNEAFERRYAEAYREFKETCNRLNNEEATGD